ncbi:MAG: DUF488 family protein [Vitreimonas sp.]
MTAPFFTIGHSNRTLEEFVGLLEGAHVRRVADVRTVPRSRANPQFNRETLPRALADRGIDYEHMADLGGLRGRAKATPANLNGLWTNESFHNYADYALTAQFATGLERLREAGHEQCCAVMCSEAVWWRCHRRIVADYLIAAGETVFHIMAAGRFPPAHLTAGAVVQPGGAIFYPSP